MKNPPLILLLFVLLLIHCKNETGVSTAPAQGPAEIAFTKLPPDQTGITFLNQPPEDLYRNILRYQYYYNGGGVALGDVNNDGLTDICFSSNLHPPELYINQGNMTFENHSDRAGLNLPGQASWNTGISMVDINGDGHLDIYLCRSGNLQAENRTNLLYINNGDGTFTEQGAAYQLNDPGYSKQAAFLDYDKDGDLDVYLANHGINFYGRSPQGNEERKRDLFSGDKLYRNDNGKFVNVTRQANIIERAFSYGLGVGVGDLNQDGWDDIYVSNDFFEPDYLYFNQGDGTFKEEIKTATEQISFFGMGNDVADINNDGWLDIMVLDMNPRDHIRKHTNLAGISQDQFWNFVNKGYHFQYMYNSLNVNNGNGTFSNTAQMAGLAETDWSWSPLIADFDNDGLKDVYITNGLRKDVLNLDFINNVTPRYAKNVGPNGQLSPEQFMQMVREIPSERINNFAFKNQGGGTFQEVTQSWKLDIPSFSNGAAYGDLDNDGDLDIVVNNLEDPPFIFRNDLNNDHYLRIKLAGPDGNPFGLGAKVYVKGADTQQFQQVYFNRGFQSSVEPVLHFGLGHDEPVNVRIVWPDGRSEQRAAVSPNQILTFDYQDSRKQPEPSELLPSPIFQTVKQTPAIAHRENRYDDFKNSYLLPHKMSTLGPYLDVGDLNADGLDDLFLGGSAGYAGQLHLQQKDGSFRVADGPWSREKGHEDMGVLFFDADGDQDLDLYVASGGAEFAPQDPQLTDRLYLNDGRASFQKSPYALPDLNGSNSCVKAADYDQDGDLDLFVGGRQIPGRYGAPASSYLLQNNDGQFSDVTSRSAPGLSEIGMVTDALWTDFNGDGQLDLLLAGEWMSPRLFQNDAGQFTEITSSAGLNGLSGWYFSLAEGDFDGDGDTDYLAGNLGLNHRYPASPEAPLELFAGDLDQNGSTDHLLTYQSQGKRLPVYGRQVLQGQLIYLKKQYTLFEAYARAGVEEILGERKDAVEHQLEARHFSSMYLENLGNGQFRHQPLPLPAQRSVIQSFLVDDFNRDGHLDVLFTGNLYGMEHRTPRLDAGTGLLLKGDGKGHFEPVPSGESGFFAAGNTRKLKKIQGEAGNSIVVSTNDGPVQVWRY